MQQVLQNIRNGQGRVATAPDPVVRPGQVPDRAEEAFVPQLLQDAPHVIGAFARLCR